MYYTRENGGDYNLRFRLRTLNDAKYHEFAAYIKDYDPTHRYLVLNDIYELATNTCISDHLWVKASYLHFVPLTTNKAVCVKFKAIVQSYARKDHRVDYGLHHLKNVTVIRTEPLDLKPKTPVQSLYDLMNQLRQQCELPTFYAQYSRPQNLDHLILTNVLYEPLKTIVYPKLILDKMQALNAFNNLLLDFNQPVIKFQAKIMENTKTKLKKNNYEINDSAMMEKKHVNFTLKKFTKPQIVGNLEADEYHYLIQHLTQVL